MIRFYAFFSAVVAIDWVALHKNDYNDDICASLEKLNPIQKKMCQRYPKLMEAVLTASKQTTQSCAVSFDSLAQKIKRPENCFYIYILLYPFLT
jgi:hypothetical protein